MSLNYKSTRISCYLAAAIQAISINLPPLFFALFSTQFGISYEQLGRLVLINFMTQLCIDAVSVYFVDRVGYRTCFIGAHSFVAVGLIAFGILPLIMTDKYVGMLISVVIYSIGAGVLEVMISPLNEQLPSDKKAASMSLMHSFYSWGQVVVIALTTVAVLAIGDSYWWLLFILWAIFPVVNAVRGFFIPFPETIPPEKRTSLKELFKTPLFWLMLLIMVCGGASEQTMAQWASLFAEKGVGISKVWGDLLGPCLFAIFMGTGRFLHGKSNGKHLNGLLIGSAALCVLCYLVTVFVPVPAVALLGCGLCGLSVSLMWPGTLSLAAERFPRGATALFACLALAGDLGCSVGPWLTGFVSDAVRSVTSSEQSGLKAGILAGVAFPLVMLIGLLITYKRKKKTTDE